VEANSTPLCWYPPCFKKIESGGQNDDRQMRPVTKQVESLTAQDQTACPRQKTTRRYGRASRQRFAVRKKKLQDKAIRETASKEIKLAATQEKFEIAKVARTYQRYFGFFSSHHRTPRHNASIHFAYLPAWHYYQRPTNLSSYNLCTVTQPPLNFRSLLGLGLNFIPRPPLSNRKVLKDNLARLRKAIYNRSVYAGEHHDYDPKLYARSNRNAPEHLVSVELWT